MGSIITDENFIYANSKEDIIKLLREYKRSKFGSNSKIYNYNGELLKVFNNVHLIDEMSDMERLRKLEPKTMTMPNKFLFINEQFYGYSMDKKPGIMFYLMNSNTLLHDFLKALELVENDIRMISKNGFFVSDLNVMNGLYDTKTKKISLVDCDSYGRDTAESIEILCLSNLYLLYSFVLSFISNIYYEADNLPGIYKYMKKLIVDKTDLDVSIYNFFNYLISILENEVDNEIHSIKDFRKALILTYND